MLLVCTSNNNAYHTASTLQYFFRNDLDYQTYQNYVHTVNILKVSFPEYGFEFQENC